MSEKIECPCCKNTLDAEWDPEGDGYVVPLHMCGDVYIQFKMSKSAQAYRCQDPRRLRRTIVKRMQIDPWPVIQSMDMQN